MSLAAIGAGSAHAAVGDDVDDSCMAFSQDAGTTWIAQAALTYDTSIHPIPGEFAKHTSFQVKNTCDTPAKFQVFTGFWTVGGDGTAQLRADIDGKTGTPATITGVSTSPDDAKLLAESGRLVKDKPVAVNLYIGLPPGETAQSFSIDPGWGFFLNEVAPGTDPGTGDGDSGSLGGSLSGGSLGDLFGSGSASGSLGNASKSQFASAPAVVANDR